MSAFIETLESRELLSASPVGVKAPPETIAADQAAITTAQVTLTSDKVQWASTLKIDRANIPAVSAEQKANIRAAQQAVRDARGNPTELQTAQGNLIVTKANAKTAIAEAKNQVKVDQGSEKIVLAADKKAITQAKLKLRQDRIAK
jgi:hypothetical protein